MTLTAHDWRERLHQRLLQIQKEREMDTVPLKNTMQEQDEMEVETQYAPDDTPAGDTEVRVLPLGWGVEHNGEIVATGSKTEMVKNARAIAKDEKPCELVVCDAKGEVVTRRYYR